MRRIFVLFCLLAGMASVVLADDVVDLAGAGGIISNSPYRGVHARVMAIPFLRLEYKDFYIRGVEAGYRFCKKGPLVISAVASPRLMGYSSEDSGALEGMEDRRMSLDAGIKAEYALPWQEMTLSALVLADVFSRNDGSVYAVALGRAFKGEIFRFKPSLGVRYQSKSLVDYYYGVKDTEVRAGRPAYEPGGAVNPFAEAVFSFGISKRLVVVTMFNIESLAPQIRKSPIVDKNYSLTAAAGLTYRF